MGSMLPTAGDRYPQTKPTQTSSHEVHRVSLRVVVLGWCLWLLGTWAGSLWIDSAQPATRWMLMGSVIGLMVIWPMARMSMDADTRSSTGRLMFCEWLTLITIFQAVVWPLSVTARWEIEQTLWLDLAVVAWSLLTALLVATGVRSPWAAHRCLVALLCVLLLVGEPALLMLTSLDLNAAPDEVWVMHISPIQTVWALAQTPIEWNSGPWRANVVIMGMGAIVAWVFYGFFPRGKARY